MGKMAYRAIKREIRWKGTVAMTFKEAKKQCRRVGTAHAQGDALRAMYAELIASRWYAVGNPEKFYMYLQSVADDERAIANEARALLRDSSLALDVALA
jgi:hypothetical protein